MRAQLTGRTTRIGVFEVMNAIGRGLIGKIPVVDLVERGDRKDFIQKSCRLLLELQLLFVHLLRVVLVRRFLGESYDVLSLQSFRKYLVEKC